MYACMYMYLYSSIMYVHAIGEAAIKYHVHAIKGELLVRYKYSCYIAVPV